MIKRKYYAPFIISLLIGFSSLSIQVLWVKLISFAWRSIPQSFSYVLIIFLFGIATGAYIGKHFCANKKYDLYSVASIALLLAAIVDIISLHILNLKGEFYNFALASFLIFSTASLKGTLFPIVHHLRVINKNRIAKPVSFIYFGNIMGATLGPLVTGFIFLAHMTVVQAFYVIGAITFLGAIFAFVCAKRKNIVVKYSTIAIAICLVIVALMPNQNIWYRLFDNGLEYIWDPNGSFKITIENQYGVINVFNSNKVYGTGLNDGKINKNLSIGSHNKNSNKIFRAYRIAGFHAHPKKFLMIGLGSGSWANIISWLPDVETIDLVESNPGYIELLGMYPDVSGILGDDRITFHIDDGRRWLNQRPDEKYDFILMNTVYHYRNHATNFLSLEFFKLIQSRLNENGVFYFNATRSPEVFLTVTKVFKNALLYYDCVVASDSEIGLSNSMTIDRLSRMKNSNGPVLDVLGDDMKYINQMLAEPLITYDHYKERIHRDVDIITDNNPVSEYKHGYLLNFMKKRLTTPTD
jgi:spermidine synthase